MSVNKFEIGDRVRVIAKDFYPCTDYGSEGFVVAVLPNDNVRVKFYKITGVPPSPFRKPSVAPSSNYYTIENRNLEKIADTSTKRNFRRIVL